eukprot:5861084-Alexandrium_andersonii.AAC.1
MSSNSEKGPLDGGRPCCAPLGVRREMRTSRSTARRFGPPGEGSSMRVRSSVLQEPFAEAETSWPV